MQSDAFCSELSRSQNEKIFGTAARVSTWILVEHPAAWGPKSFPDERLAEGIQRGLRALVKAYPRSRPLMIRQQHPHQWPEELQAFVVHSHERHPEAFRLRGGDYEELISPPAEPEPWTKPLYLVCTHGTHDKCCAKFGFATYCATRNLATEEVWECSHVGGDRFAGNVVCLPHGIYYGNVFAEDTRLVVEAYRRNEVVLRHFRGRCCYPKVAQIGEYFVRAESGILGLDDLRFLGSDDLDGTAKRVRFEREGAHEIHEVEFRQRPDPLSEFLTCKALEPQPVSQYELTGYRVFNK